MRTSYASFAEYTVRMESVQSTSVGLSRAQIVGAGVRIADVEGLPAVTMRRVATELGAGVMSLYRHVRDKHELLRAMTESIIATAPYPDEVPGDWADAVRLAAKLDWGIYRAHPWMVLTISSPRYYSDEHCLEWMIGALRPLTTDASLARSMTLAVWSFTQGASLHRVDPESRSSRSTFIPTDDDFAIGLESLIAGMAQVADIRR